jgi:hypothetical protein
MMLPFINFGIAVLHNHPALKHGVVKVKFTLKQTMKPQWAIRGTALLFL